MPSEPAKMNELFLAETPALLAMNPSTLVRPRVARERATQLTATLIREFKPLEPQLDAELSPARAAARRADFAAVHPNALIFYAADLAVEVPWTSDQKARRADLVKKAREHDEYLGGWAIPLFKKDEALRDQVADIVRGKGIRDDAEDTVRWVSLFRGAWNDVKGKTPVTIEDLDGAEADATELLGLLDGAGDEAPGSPRDLRRRAYTRWLLSYKEIHDLGRYLLRADPAAAARFPGVSSERGEAAAAEEPEPAAPAPPPVQPV